MFRTVLMALASTVFMTSCVQRAYDREDAAVAENYPHRREATCPSWLYSHKTGQRYCASPKVKLTHPLTNKPQAPKPDRTANVDVNDRAQMLALGEEVYTEVCAACHQGNGEGVAGSFPPLKGAGGYYGSAENHAKIIVHGLAGEIEVAADEARDHDHEQSEHDDLVEAQHDLGHGEWHLDFPKRLPSRAARRDDGLHDLHQHAAQTDEGVEHDQKR